MLLSLSQGVNYEYDQIAQEYKPAKMSAKKNLIQLAKSGNELACYQNDICSANGKKSSKQKNQKKIFF